MIIEIFKSKTIHIVQKNVCNKKAINLGKNKLFEWTNLQIITNNLSLKENKERLSNVISLMNSIQNDPQNDL